MAYSSVLRRWRCALAIYWKNFPHAHSARARSIRDAYHSTAMHGNRPRMHPAKYISACQHIASQAELSKYQDEISDLKKHTSSQVR